MLPTAILDRFVERCPAVVMIRATLERLLRPERLDQIFEQARQDLFFGSLHGVDDFGRVGGCLPDYNRVGLWLDMIDFVVKSGRRNAQTLFSSLISGMDRFMGPRGDGHH